mmetsp:Transcript_8109/g.36900  ORF Transcript_8109/g.36900 Transcript_8109/m.36900 type:complete len:257 (-) Transcript_8109:431-1201(-)
MISSSSALSLRLPRHETTLLVTLAPTRSMNQSITTPNSPRPAPLVEHLVDDAVVHGLLGGQVKITANVVVHLVLRLARRPADHLVDLGANLEQLPALVPDVRRGPARDARGVVQHDAGVRQRGPLAFGAAREEHAAHGSGAAKADASDVGFDMSHGVEDGHGRHDVSSLGIDVQVDVLTALVDAVEVEHGRDELVTELFVDLLADPDDAFAVEAVPDVDPLPGVLVRGLVRDARDSDGHHGGDGSAAFAGPGGHGE